MKRNNRGFTLVEIIIVVAIIGALTGIISMSISSVYSTKARRCASEMDAFISMCKVNVMSRAGTIAITLDVDDNGCIRGTYYENGVSKDSRVFSDANVSATFTVNGVTTDLSPTDTLTLSFDRNTGGFKPQGEISGVSTYCTAIDITCGRTYVITLVPSTGNHSIS